jgi:hypothetical protein
MAALSAIDKTPEEELVHWVIVGTWVIWLVGGLYHVYPIAAWTLAGWGFCRRFGLIESDARMLKPLPAGVWVWMAGMTLMALALIIGHVNFELGLGTLIKSMLGWMKGWALFAVLPFAGASLRIRPQVLYRALNLLSAQTLVIAPVFFLASMTGLPPVLYTSPLYYLGGAPSTFFDVGTHWIDPGVNDIRFRLYAPWSPAMAFTAQLSMMMGLFDRDWRWRIIAVVTAMVACMMAKSRLSLVALPVLMLAIPLLSQLYRPAMVGLTGAASLIGALSFNILMRTVDAAVASFNNARADSSRVRATLQRMAVHRWQNEAPVFGHGAVERGSHLVEFMPIGSHHTWNGLLFVKGGVGFLALAGPFLWTFIEILIKAQRDRVARACLGVMIVLFINSFGENLEILSYLAWPGLLLIGIALNRRTVGLWTETLGAPR